MSGKYRDHTWRISSLQCDYEYITSYYIQLTCGYLSRLQGIWSLVRMQLLNLESRDCFSVKYWIVHLMFKDMRLCIKAYYIWYIYAIYIHMYICIHIYPHTSALSACLYLRSMHLVSIEDWKRMSITGIPDSCDLSMGADKRIRSSVRSKSTLSS